MKTLAIIVAAGRGERMGAGRPKAFIELSGESLLVRSARALDASPSVDGIVAVVGESELGLAQQQLQAVGKLHAVVAGGSRRQDSVLAGLEAAPDGFDGIVLIHDAARPFVTPALVDVLTREAETAGAAIPVWPVADTVKRVRDGRIVETVDRSDLVAAQTPQAFRYDLLVRAYEAAFRDRVTVTDEAMALERLGEPVAAVTGEGANRKLTTPGDLVWAEAMLAAAR